MFSQTSKEVSYSATNGRAYITFERPEKRNALTYEMFNQMMAYIRQAEEDDDVRIIIFRAEGDHFSAGHDLSQVGKEYGFDPSGKGRRPSQRARLHWDKHHIEQFRNICFCVKPTLGLIKGYCVGAGLHLIEACDFAIADETAKIGHPEQKMGLAGAAYMTTWNIVASGPKKAREILMLGDILTPAAAMDAGFVNKVVPRGELDSAGEEWAEKIVRLPRDAVAFGKAAFHLAYDSLGMNTQFVQGYVMHALSTNIRFEEDEMNFMREKRDKGVAAAAKDREDRYKNPSE
ncbi:MAG TPA: enoyl-CoA hydratase/isomerase family protein [Paracoccus solventivorans]|uniref:Enoyl-CoA hydratase/isomerase family protein n=1 Tax=Paracoccus solventivorans TaxID=53463 RepID=A0A832PL88_9RHOB|nr:enoyl-CoA hydratase/isomerase family protein [Paracoccus solventivorans]HHW33669.1 enoyl-CoA hydratase/isomerase family protein [Paracoccus solventivorans]